VDLSHADFKEQSAKVAHYGRGGYYKVKAATHRGKVATGRSLAKSKSIHRDQQLMEDPDVDVDIDDDDEEEPETDEDDAEVHDAQHKGKGVERGSPPLASEQKGKEEQESIQILDLHSHNPIIKYRGRVFEADWAEVIGTEAIFSRHDPSKPLPALRNLADNVDLLGASASKILTREKVLKPRKPEADGLADIRKDWNIRIPVGKDKAGEKGQQARFLENLIALKKKKGEKDEVTVYAKPSTGSVSREQQPPFLNPRQRRKVADDSATEFQEVEFEGIRRRSRKVGSRWNRAGSRQIGMEGDGDHGGSGAQLSTPTPVRWSHMMTPDGRRSDQEGALEREPPPSTKEGDDGGAVNEPLKDSEVDNEAEDIHMTG
jgi:hypothetical protein